MATDPKDAAKNLLAKVTALTACTSADTPQWKAAYDQVADAWKALRDLTLGSSTTDLGEFFKNIGSGLIEAQKKLDIESESYIRRALRLEDQSAGAGRGADVANTAPALASMFRIPRINAELKCSLETDNEKKLNLIFYSDRNDVREMHQQTVQLEVVSVPAPPDYINYLRANPAKKEAPAGAALKIDDDDDLVPVVGLNDRITPTQQTTAPKPAAASDSALKPSSTGLKTVAFADFGDDDDDDAKAKPPVEKKPAADSEPALPAAWQGRFADEPTRAEARNLIEEIDLKQNGQRRTLVKEHLLPSWNKALVLRDGDGTRFILLALMGKRPELLLWQLIVHPTSLALLYRMPVGPRAQSNVVRAQRFLADIGETQAKSAADKR